MSEHKVRYKTTGNPTNGCIHTMAKYAITIVRRDICPGLIMRSSKKLVKDGIVQRRRNVTTAYDEAINVVQKDHVHNGGPIRQVQPSTEKESTSNLLLTPVNLQTGSDSLTKKNIIEEYKKEVQTYAKTYSSPNPDGWFHICELEQVCFVLLYIDLVLRSNHLFFLTDACSR